MNIRIDPGPGTSPPATRQKIDPTKRWNIDQARLDPSTMRPVLDAAAHRGDALASLEGRASPSTRKKARAGTMAKLTGADSRPTDR